jgi:type I restriction enzyme S subunit
LKQPESEQERIAMELERQLSEGDATHEMISANLRRIERLRQAILKWAFEGKLVDQDPNDEPASELLARIRTEREAAEKAPRPARAREKVRKAT